MIRRKVTFGQSRILRCGWGLVVLALVNSGWLFREKPPGRSGSDRLILIVVGLGVVMTGTGRGTGLTSIPVAQAAGSDCELTGFNSNRQKG